MPTHTSNDPSSREPQLTQVLSSSQAATTASGDLHTIQIQLTDASAVSVESYDPYDDRRPYKHQRRASQATITTLSAASTRKILIYNLVSQTFSLSDLSELEGIPADQVKVANASLMSAECVMEQDFVKGRKATAKIMIPPYLWLDKLMGKWKVLYVIRGQESLLWKGC